MSDNQPVSWLLGCCLFSIVAVSWSSSVAEESGSSYFSGLFDPTRPPAGLSSGSVLSGRGGVRDFEVLPELTSTLISERRRVAMIDGKLLREGDRVGDKVIVEITSGRVRLQQGRETSVLRVFQNSGLKIRQREVE